MSNMDDKTLVPALVEKRQEVLNELRQFEEQISELEAELSARIEQRKSARAIANESLVHIDALLRIEGSHESPGDAIEPHDSRAGRKRESIDGAYELLCNAGKPMHYREIAETLTDGGIHLPGKNPAATLLTKMSRDARFGRSPRRGTYGLAGWKTRKQHRMLSKGRSKGARKTR